MADEIFLVPRSLLVARIDEIEASAAAATSNACFT